MVVVVCVVVVCTLSNEQAVLCSSSTVFVVDCSALPWQQAVAAAVAAAALHFKCVYQYSLHVRRRVRYTGIAALREVAQLATHVALHSNRALSLRGVTDHIRGYQN
jgi:hypothetical protein